MKGVRDFIGIILVSLRYKTQGFGRKHGVKGSTLNQKSKGPNLILLSIHDLTSFEGLFQTLWLFEEEVTHNKYKKTQGHRTNLGTAFRTNFGPPLRTDG
jgi:hypothetical protein